jgi:hypothetical protein
MAIASTRLDGQNIGLHLTGGSTAVNVFTVDLLTGEATSTYLTSVDLSIVQSAAVALFQTVPIGQRATATFLTRLVTVAPADNNTITLSISTVGNLATLVATVSATPASLVIHIQHSITGYVAWGVGFASGAPVPPGTSDATFTADCLAGDAVGACVYVTGASMGGIMQVATCDPSDETKMPAVGIIVSKPAATSATVQRLAVADISASAAVLTPGSRAWVGFTGLPVSVPPLPGASPSGYVMLQTVGVATGAAALEVKISADMLKSL